MNLEMRIRFKMLRISKKIKDLKEILSYKIENFLAEQEDDLKDRLVSTSACMVATTAISAHNVSAALNASSRTMHFKKLAMISIAMGAVFSYVWWRMPASRVPLTGDDVDTVIGIVRESGCAPPDHMQPVVDIVHAGLFQGGGYRTLGWEKNLEEDEDTTRAVPGYEAFVKDGRRETSYGRREESYGEYEEIEPPYDSCETIPRKSLRDIPIRVKEPNEDRTKANVVNSLIDTVSTSHRKLDVHKGSSKVTAQDLQFNWMKGD